MAGQSKILIRNARLYDHDGDTDQPGVCDVLVEDDRIVQVAAAIGDTADARVIDASDKLLIPGFVNAHYHSHDVLLRGCFENLPTEMWFMYALPPVYPQRSAEEVRVRTMLAAAEAIRNGITTVQDMLTILPFDTDLLDIALETYDAVGLRVVFAQQIADLRALDRVPYWRECVPEAHHHLLAAAADSGAVASDPVDVVIEEYLAHNGDHDRISWALGPTNPMLCSPDMMRRLSAFSAEHDLPVFMHFYQSRAEAVGSRQLMGDYGGSLIPLLEEVGLLNERPGSGPQHLDERPRNFSTRRCQSDGPAKPRIEHEVERRHTPGTRLRRRGRTPGAGFRQLRLQRFSEHVPADETVYKSCSGERARTRPADRGRRHAICDAWRRTGDGPRW